MTPIFIFLSCVIFLAAINKSIGVRRAYVKLLLKIFEYGRQNIETAKKQTRKNLDNDDDNEPDNENENDNEIKKNNNHNDDNVNNDHPDGDGNNDNNDGPINNENDNNLKEKTNKLLNGNGGIINNYETSHSNNNGNSVISRDTLILLPDGDIKQNNTTTNNCKTKINDEKCEKDDKNNAENDEFSFNLSKCLDYVKAGVEAIIEDEVTSRFEAEELKNWNLLTRTNRHYEFISWRLTVIWMCGFIIRYFILMPLRVFICFVGLCFAIISMSFVGYIPNHKIRQYFAELSYKLMFRIFIRSVSTILTFHNVQYRPNRSGFCVANHTTPMDIAMLSTETTFCLVIWLTICTALVGSMPDGDSKREMVHMVINHCFGVLSSAISAVINYHNIENRPKKGICVANHTSPIDVLVLMCDNTYSLIGQRHGGFLGILQRALARASPHIWFERAEAKDRHAVAQRLRQHVSDPKNPPILIFPEGTCINNTSVMQFKKGSFEVGGTIYPVAIKYDPRFGDAFWNSSRYSMLQYLYMMMTSWAIVCDVWYLPPMYRQDNESAIDFANRVKSVIAKQGGLVDLVWDGQLKRMKPKKEWKEKHQIEFTKRLKGE